MLLIFDFFSKNIYFLKSINKKTSQFTDSLVFHRNVVYINKYQRGSLFFHLFKLLTKKSKTFKFFKRTLLKTMSNDVKAISTINLGLTANLNIGNVQVPVKTSKLSLLFDTFHHWSTSSDINCYTKVFEYKSVFARILWLFILCASTFFTFYLIELSIFNYYNYEVVTQIQVNTDTAMTTLFPAVTLCDTNAFITSVAQDFFYNVSVENKIDAYGDPMRVATLMKMAAANPSYGDVNRKKLGFAANQIYSCTYNGNVDCAKSLQWYYMFDYGNCVQFNVNETNLTKAQKPGEQFGIVFGVWRFNDNWYDLFIEII